MSTCAPWTLKNECANPKCQHEKDSHHLGVDNCLVLHCECKRFVKAGEKAKLEEGETVVYRSNDDEEAGVDTPRMPGWPWGPWP